MRLSFKEGDKGHAPSRRSTGTERVHLQRAHDILFHSCGTFGEERVFFAYSNANIDAILYLLVR